MRVDDDITRRFVQRLGLTASATAVVALTMTPSADAAEPTGVVLAPVQRDGQGEAMRVDLEATQRDLTDALTEALEARFSLVVPGKVDCPRDDRACWIGAAADHDAAFMVWPRLVADGGDSHIEVDIVDVAAGRTAKQTRQTCEICGHREFEEFVDVTAAQLAVTLAGVDPEPATLAVVGEPYGAQIRVDGAVVGEVPWEGEVGAGVHEIHIEKPGFVQHQRGVEAQQGARTTVDVDLLVDQTYKKRVMRAAGWTMVGVGAATLVAGGVLLGLHGEPHRASCSPRDAQGRCPNEYDSRTPGVAVTLTGAALSLGGGGVLVYERVKDQRTRGQARLTAGGLEVKF